MNSALPDKQFFSVPEIAATGLASVQTLRREIKLKRLLAHRVRNAYVISRAGLETYLQSCQVDGGYDYLLRAVFDAWDLLTTEQKQELVQSLNALVQQDQNVNRVLTTEVVTEHVG